MSLWTIIPVRGLAAGKSRLAGVLTPERRRELNVWFLEHTLQVVGEAFGGLERCVVTSPCAEARRLAREAGALALEETSGTGLNAALDAARDYVRSHGGHCLLVLPCDLALLSARALLQLVEEATAHRNAVVIVPDRDASGTNALLLSAGMEFGFAFGERSFMLHTAEAERAGAALRVCRIDGLALDVDRPADLEDWSNAGGPQA